MNYWFECKVSYERQADSMGMKKVSESYLVDALNFTEAERRIIEEVTPLVSMGELEVVNIRRARIAELFLNDIPEDDRYFRAKVNFITIDEKSGSEKKTSATMIVKSDSLPNNHRAGIRTPAEVSLHLPPRYIDVLPPSEPYL